MRSALISAAAIAVCFLAGVSAPAAGPDCAAPPCGCRGACYEGLDPAFNCGCNGSYKFPVPPLYTYHWPGMYSAQWMTDYRSPWRFPPLRPYADEAPAVEVGTSQQPARGVRPVALSLPLAERRSGEMEAMSSKLLRK